MLRNQFARAGSMRLLTCVFAALLIYCLTVSLLPLFSTNTAVAQDDLSDILGLHINEINKYLDALEEKQKITSTQLDRGVFYQVRK